MKIKKCIMFLKNDFDQIDKYNFQDFVINGKLPVFLDIFSKYNKLLFNIQLDF